MKDLKPFVVDTRLEDYMKSSKWKGKIFMQDEKTCFKDGFNDGFNMAYKELELFEKENEKLKAEITELKKMDEENAKLKLQIIESLEEENEKLKQQIEKTKCCHSCKSHKLNNLKNCQTCDVDYSKWELAE